MRLFIGVKPDRETAAYLKKKAEEAEKLFKGARMTPHDNYHITLVFIGQCGRRTYMEAVKAVREAAGETPVFNVEIDGAGSFSRRRKKLCFYSIKKNETMEKLRGILYSRLNKKGIVEDEREFLPHMTFARDVRTEAEISDAVGVKKSFKAEELLLMESRRGRDGLEYPAVYKARLKGGMGNGQD